jgi:hypothetical protein
MQNRKSDFIAEISQNRAKMLDAIANGDSQIFLEKVGSTWKGYVKETFDMQGPGWEGLKKRTMAARKAKWTGKIINGKKEMKKSHKILWVSGALARSVDYMVKRG